MSLKPHFVNYSSFKLFIRAISKRNRITFTIVKKTWDMLAIKSQALKDKPRDDKHVSKGSS